MSLLKDKLNKIQKSLREQKADLLMIGYFGFFASDDFLYYLLLKNPEIAMLVIPDRGEPTLYGINFEVTQLQKLYPEFTVKPFDKPVEHLLLPHIKNKKKIAIRKEALPVKIFEDIKKLKIKINDFKNHKYIVAKKLPEEIAILEEACDITDKLFSKLTKNWSRFTTEKDASGYLLVEMAKLSIEPSFAPIIASGANAANPHHHTSIERIKKGFCVIDMGVRYGGYCSDMTRTIYVGKPNEKDKKLYQNVLEIQKATVEKVAPGICTDELDNFCREKLGKLDKEFIHGLGHGLGSQVHEWPSVSRGQKVELEEDMLITIEPGIYRPNKYGIRIEDDVLVTKKGHKVLSRSDKNLIIV